MEGNETAALALEDLTGNQQQYVQEMLAADLAVLATATGELDITSSTLGQEIVVERVLQGNGLDAGSTCTVWQEYGLQVIDGEIAYNNVLNLMQPGKQYLIFLTDQSLNRVSDDRNYLVASTWFGYLPVPFSPDVALPDDSRYDLYAEWADYPAFLATPEIAQARNAITVELLQHYGLYESGSDW